MTRKRFSTRTAALTVCALLALTAAAPATAQKHYKDLKYPPLRDLELPRVDRSVLPNGLVLYLVEDHSLPRVNGFALIKTGARFEPADKVGLGSILGQAMRTGGSVNRKGEEIDRLLENVGASVETSVGTTSTTASLFALKEDLPLVLEVLADVLRNPALPEDKIELAKVQQRSGIARRNDNVGAIATREFVKLLYGADNPYARTTEYASIANITREDLVEFHQRYFHPNQVILGLWGDFDPAAVKALVKKQFGSWARKEVALPPLPAVPADWQGSVNYIQKDDVNQTNLRIGHLGGRLDDPDYFALNVMSEILGGGLSSRLFRRVRSDLGLAYTCGGGWSAQFDRPGSFFTVCNTKSETTVQAARAVVNEIRRLTAEPVSDEELRVAKEGILNSFVFNFDTKGEIIQRLMTYEYYGYPSDFLDKFKANIERVTADDVQRAARERLHPDKLVILAVGRGEKFDEPLSALGEVRTIDISIPPLPAEKAPEATAATRARGRDTLQAAARALGGLETLTGVQDMTILASLTQVTPQGAFELTTKSFLVKPDKFRRDVVAPFGEITFVVDGDTGWQKSPRGSGPLPPALVALAKKGMARDFSVLLPEALAGEREVQFLETAEVEGAAADVVMVTDAAGDSVRLYVEQASGNIVKMVFQSMAPGRGVVQEERYFSDFRPVSGLTVPFKVVIFQDGEKSSETLVTDVELNTGVDPSLFARSEE